MSAPLQVNLVMDNGRSLGLMIRGGSEYNLGIYITGVDRGSAAELGGLKVNPGGWGEVLPRPLRVSLRTAWRGIYTP